MTVEGEDERKNNSRYREMNMREVNMKYGRSVVFIRRDSARIWGFKYGLSIGIGPLKNMASTGVFVRVVCALNNFTSSFLRQHA